MSTNSTPDYFGLMIDRVPVADNLRGHLGSTAPRFLSDAEDDARPEAQQVLFVPLAIRQLCTQVVGLDGADGAVSIDGQVEPSACQDCPRVGRSGQRTAGTGEQPVEAVSGAYKPLHKGGESSAGETVAEAWPDSEGDQRQASPAVAPMLAARSPVKSATTDSARKAWKATSLLPPFMLKQLH
jgi:hypothetical protein